MFQKQPYHFSKITIIAIACVSMLLIYFFRWHGDDGTKFKYIVDGDGRDYYSYLVSIFINKNLANQDIRNWYVIPTPTGTINVHTVGVSLLLLPFFCIGYIWSFFSNAELNGLSEPFQKMVSVGGLFYLVLGLLYLKRLLIEFDIRDKIIVIVLVLIFFGTNLLNYALSQPSMSHVYSFALISAFLFYVKKTFQEFSNKYLYISAVLLGLIILVRPVNAIIILAIPFLANSFDNLKITIQAIFYNKKSLMLSTLIFLLLLSIQSVVWYSQNQHFIQWGYKGNGFYFDRPQTWLMLFGFNAGFFIYTPLCFVIFFGFIPLYSQNKFRFFALLFFMAGCFYLFSSYWAYTYFDGLSIRTFVDFYSLFAILLSILLTHIANKKIKYLIIILLAVSSLLNLVFCYQYQAGILPESGMNFKKFKYIFLKTDNSYIDILGGCMDLAPYAKEDPKAVYNHSQREPYAFNQNEFGLGYHVSPLNLNSNKLYLKIHLKRKEEFLNSSLNALLVVSVESGAGISKNYYACKLNDTPPENCCEWEELDYGIVMDAKLLPSDKLSIYIWNKNKQPFLIDDYTVEIYNYNF